MARAASARFSLTPDTLLSELLHHYPQVRAVLDHYGPCGGEDTRGSSESLRGFAHDHGVDERSLMDEIRRAIVASAHHPGRRAMNAGTSDLSATIYRPYFLGGIAVVLTVGAVWGAWLLWKIGIEGSFTSASIHEVNAHGHAQIFGWVGLFIMGFALQALPGLWRVALPAPRLALASFVAMVLGITVRTVAMASGGTYWALGAGLVELAAIVTVVGILLAAFRRSTVTTEPYMAFVMAALGWFVIQAGVSVWHTWTTMTAPHVGELVWYVSTYQAPLRDIQIHGLALLMILGVSIRMLPAMFGVERIGDRRAWWAFALLMVAVSGEALLFIAYRWSGNHVWASGLLVSWLLLLVGVALVALPWKLWRPMPTRDRSAKFIRAAYGWLAVSLVMLLLLPVYQWLSGIAFSHAYYGAIRHAITVGFISMMIMGMAAKVVPSLTGRDPHGLPMLWLPFVLINVGCFLRVSTQTLTDWHPGGFAVIGVSGTLEVTALMLWGGHLIRLMCRNGADSTPPRRSASRPARIEPNHTVAQVLAWFPETKAIFDEMGFSPLRSPLLRRVFAGRVTLAQAANARGVGVEHLVGRLNETIAAETRQPGVVRYDATVGELLRAAPGAAKLVAALGLNTEHDAALTLAEAATRAGWPREAVIAAAAEAVHGSCTGGCEGCGAAAGASESTCNGAASTARPEAKA